MVFDRFFKERLNFEALFLFPKYKKIELPAPTCKKFNQLTISIFLSYSVIKKSHFILIILYRSNLL